MSDLATLIIFPVIVGVIVLLVEYFVIQPIRKAKSVSIPRSSSISRDWMTAIKTGVKQFKAQQPGYVWNWWSRDRHNIAIEEWSIEKGQATLTLAVSAKQSVVNNPIPGVISFGTAQRVIARYQLTIDRTGDILRMISIPVQNDAADYPASATHPRAKGIVLKEVKKPITEVTHEGLKVRIEFVAENWGKATRIYPYVEYKVAEFIGGKFVERVVSSPPSWAVDLDAYSSTLIPFEATFDATTVILTKPPNKVKVKLFRKPRNKAA